MPSNPSKGECLMGKVNFAGHRNKTPQMEIVDGEAISWLFYKTATVEFNELYYYY